MLALGDSLALVLSRLRGFTTDDFARFHPGGNLGRKLSRVDDVMRPLSQCRVARQSQTLRQTLVSQSRPGRRTGAIMIVGDDSRLAGVFTDSDLARLLEQNRDAAIDQPLEVVMTRDPASVPSGTLLSAACEVLSRRKISELPVIDNDGKPIGLIDITDVVGVEQSEEVQGSGTCEAGRFKVQSRPTFKVLTPDP
jgi:arabinose-5-phosphate isomerase